MTRAVVKHLSEWTLWQRITYPFSGWARRSLDADTLCGECYCRWSYGRWFPRWCRTCLRLKRDGWRYEG